MPLLVTLVVPSLVVHFQLHSHMSAIYCRYNANGLFYWADMERKGLLDLFIPAPRQLKVAEALGSPTGSVLPGLDEACPGTGSLRVPSP